jgi:hypothetical protein
MRRLISFEPLEAIRCPELSAMRRRAVEDSECLRHIFRKPGGQSWGSLLIPSDHLLEATCCLWLIIGIKDASEVSRDIGSHRHFWHMGHGIADGVELPLPGNSAERGGTSSLTAGMVIADNEFDAPHSPRQKALQELSPVWLSFTHGNAAAKD